MEKLTTEVALNVLIDWLQNNIDCGNVIIFDNDNDDTDSAVLLPWIVMAIRDVCALRYLQLMHQASTV